MLQSDATTICDILHAFNGLQKCNRGLNIFWHIHFRGRTPKSPIYMAQIYVPIIMVKKFEYLLKNPNCIAPHGWKIQTYRPKILQWAKSRVFLQSNRQELCYLNYYLLYCAAVDSEFGDSNSFSFTSCWKLGSRVLIHFSNNRYFCFGILCLLQLCWCTQNV